MSEKLTRKQENLVAELRGLPKANARARIKKTTGIDELMGRLLEKHRLLTPRIESQLMPNWGYVVGEHNAHRCAPLKIENNILKVACSHPVMVREMTFSKKMILRRLQSVCPTIREIKFITG